MMKCKLCGEGFENIEETLGIACSTERIHKKCYALLNRPMITCPYCGEKVSIQHTFGDGMLLTRDSIVLHRDPRVRKGPGKGPYHPDLLKHAPWATGQGDPSICPMSDRTVNPDGTLKE
jgi:DNA-directed RNA polymerase subunit RPC12/RpoP